MNRLCVLAVLPAALLLAGCSRREAAAAATDNSPNEVVKTEVVQLQPVQDELTIAAKIMADPAKVVRVYSPAGGRLLRVEVRPGDRVAKGQTVAILESSDVAQARADHDRATIEANRTQKAFDRAKLLLEHRAMSERDYQQSEADALEAKAELNRAAERLRILGAPTQGSSNQVALVAPRSGSVLELDAAPGELSKSTDNANPICTIADLSEVWVVGDVFERDLGAVHAGDAAEITMAAYSDERWRGRVAVISDAIDPQSRTLKVRIVLPNLDHKLKPEMFGTVHLRRPEWKAIVVPASAVLREGGDMSVMVQTKPGTYERRLVTVRSSDAQRAVIASGLKPGDAVVVQGTSLVRGDDNR